MHKTQKKFKMSTTQEEYFEDYALKKLHNLFLELFTYGY